MKLSAKIRVTASDADTLEAAFRNEQGDFGRSRCSVDKNGDEVVFTIEADDPTALRATVSSITKLLTVYEKVDG